MAGPVCTVLLPVTVIDVVRRKVSEILLRLTEGESGPEFWVVNTFAIGGAYSGSDGGRPFLWTWDGERKWEPDELQVVETELGWRPRGEIGLMAMCNEVADHRILAEIAAAVAEEMEGIVDLGGVPAEDAPGLTLLESAAPSFGPFISAPNLRRWLTSQSCRMTK